jgi:hypothetical protein
MEAKLIKTGNEYLLKDLKGEVLAITSGLKEGRMLSLKNCQEIKRGYDLYELAKASMNKINILFNNSLDSKSHTIGFRAGWHHAIKILGDKKFSEENIEEAFAFGQLNQLHDLKYFSGSKAYIQSLQQTEWDVEIEMDILNEYDQPILDADGCLILKRKI